MCQSDQPIHFTWRKLHLVGTVQSGVGTRWKVAFPMVDLATNVEATHVNRCRSCEREGLRLFLDLGSTPIANALLAPDADLAAEKSYPLALAFCENCSLVQLAFELPAEAIFDEHYPYYSSFSTELCVHAEAHATQLLTSRKLGCDSLVVELASNDGYLLRNFVAAGIPVLGIDPSPGPAVEAEKVGVPTLIEFFNAQLATKLREDGQVADVIIANNVMAHVPDLNGFVEGMAILLADDGIITIENPYVRELIQNVEFDGVYHEHFSYFSCMAVNSLMRRHGLYLNDVELFQDLHGGTLRWSIGKNDERSARAAEYLAEEENLGMQTFDFYRQFGDAVKRSSDALRELLTQLREQGKSIAAYGAAAKGATLLNSIGIGGELLSYVVDRNWHKQNMLMPGCHLPICDPVILTTNPPDYLLLLAWNFKHEIMVQLESYPNAGGRFIVPVPYPQVL